MFGIDAKEIFQQKISDIIVVLFGIHLFVVILNYIIKWVRPLLKERAAECNKKKSKVPSEYSLLFGSWSKNNNNRTSICSECECEIIDDDFITTFENLKTVIDMAENPSKGILDSSSLIKINMMSDSEFENALSLGNFIRKVGKRKCSSEAQTNITIDPGMMLDYSCPDLVCQDLFPDSVIKRNESSESFLSVRSINSGADFKKELEQIIIELESNDDGLKEKTEEDITIQKLQKYLKASLEKADVASSFERRDSGNDVIQENRLLEMAITEFEKELKPIKDQIQILKECISGYDLKSNPRLSAGIPSDFTSSFSGSGMFTESVSGTTCCSTDMQGYFSSYHIVSASSIGSLESDSRHKNMKKLDRIASLNASKYKHKNNRSNRQFAFNESSNAEEVLNPPEGCKSSKRSPIAEMYVKLSQCNSQSSCLVKGKKEKIASSDNAVTYRIDLNLNLAGVPAPNCQKSKLPKERAIQPLTSDPDEIFGNPTNTQISARPPIK